MTLKNNTIKIGYFGKIPARSDFIKATDNSNLTNIVDGWLTSAMELLATDPNWKTIYDNVLPMHFAIAATRIPRAVAGHLVTSHDQAERRFPFISLGALQIPQSEPFLLFSPLILGMLWNRLEAQTNQVLKAEDATVALRQLSADIELPNLNAEGCHDDFEAFLEDHSLTNLQSMLATSGYDGDLRQLFVALGLLLHPVMASGTNRLDKCLLLPLPSDPQQQHLVATFWMQLVSPFLLKADFELALIITQIKHKQVMVIGFDGASPHTLRAIMDPSTGQEHVINFDNTEWVEDPISKDYRLEQFSNCLNQPSLLLHTALSYFKELFLG